MNRIARSFLALALAAGCGPPDPDPTASKTSLGTAQAGELSVGLYSDAALETGMTPIYVKLTDASGQLVTGAAVTFVPLMTMMTGIHSAPVIGAPTAGADGLYRCDVVFQMASGSMGSWSATVGVTPAGAATAQEAVVSPLTVTDSGRVAMFTAPDTSKYVMSLNFSAAPKVGLNPVVVTLHEKQDAMTFAPVEGATIHMNPQMPSMGHGSSGTVDPTSTSPGVYGGQLSFSMMGTWETTFTVSIEGAEITDPANRPKITVTF